LKLPDENGAHHGTPGTDPLSGVRYIIGLNFERLYLTGPCRICGVETLSSTPEQVPCLSHAKSAVARNENEEAEHVS
jgi:hypothetical protein